MEPRMRFCLLSITMGLMIGILQPAFGQTSPATMPAAPAVVPGKGLAEHDFFYAGEAKDRKMSIVKKGQVVWSYDDPAGKGEISDAILMSNGNVLFAHQFAVEEITADKKVVWKYDAPQGSEIHTAVPIGREHVLFIQNGNPAVLKVVNIVTGETRTQFELPIGNPKSVHGQFRHARLTAAGTVVVAHMDLGKVVEYDSQGKEIWSIPAAGAWGVTPLKNGNFLIVDRGGVREVNREKQTTWEIGRADLPEYKLSNLQLAWRLADGNTILNNWFNQWNGSVDENNAPVQAIEVTPEKKVVWALRSWKEPDLGPATTIQILGEGEAIEDATFGDIK
jgi:outer membrane protein assembly factor BamB